MKNISVVILAAGQAHRFGAHKILQNLPNNLSIIRQIVHIVLEAGFQKPIIVTKEPDHLLRQELSDVDCVWISNPDAHLGMSTSLQKGIQNIPEDADAAMVVLADQPFITVELLQKLTIEYNNTHSQIVYPLVQGKRSNPVILDRTVFSAVMELRGDVGARALLPGFSVTTIDWPDKRLPLDVDTPADYERVLAEWSS